MGEREVPDQLELGLELWEPVPAPWWPQAIEHETEGDHEAG